jgi:Methyltransferase domain
VPSIVMRQRRRRRRLTLLSPRRRKQQQRDPDVRDPSISTRRRRAVPVVPRFLVLLLAIAVGRGQQLVRVVDSAAAAGSRRLYSCAFLPTQQQQQRRRVRWTNCRRRGSPLPYPPVPRLPLTMSLPIFSSSSSSSSSPSYVVGKDDNKKHENGPGPAPASPPAATAPAPAADNSSSSTSSTSSSSSASSHHLLLDRFVGLLHESLANAATQNEEEAEARQSSSSSTEHGPKKEGGNNDAVRADSSSSAMLFQSLTVDFATAGSTTATNRQKTKNNRASADSSTRSSPLPGSVKRIAGRLVQLSKPPAAAASSSSSSSSSRRTRQRKGTSYGTAADFSSTVVLQVTHKYHGATDIVKNYPVDGAAQSLHELLNWVLRRTELREQQQQHEIGMQVHDEDIAGDNSDAPASVQSVATEWGIANLVPSQQVTLRGALDTTAGRYVLTVPPSSAGSNPKKNRQPRPSLQHLPNMAGPNPATAMREHDRPRNRKVCIEDEFWKLVGVTTIATASSGDSRATAVAPVAVKPDMIAKVRQCEKFVEIVDGLVREVAGLGTPPNGGATASTGQPAIRITDLGCGKGYLTYALHSYLQKKQRLRQDDDDSNSRMYSNVTTIGIDIRPKLVRELNQIVSDLRIPGLQFEQGSIQDACLGDAADAGATTSEPGTSDKSVQVFIALHACDTATDDALFSAIQRDADVIVTAPCCHKQLRPQINDLVLGGRTSKDVHPLADVLRHGIYRERMSETVTDAIRAMLLELAGYKTNVFEFVGGEHTAKNCMITGVRRPTRSSAKDLENIRHRIRLLAEFYGIRHHKLADWMGEQSLLISSRRDGDEDDVASPLPARRSNRNMPPSWCVGT